MHSYNVRSGISAQLSSKIVDLTTNVGGQGFDILYMSTSSARISVCTNMVPCALWVQS